MKYLSEYKYYIKYFEDENIDFDDWDEEESDGETDIEIGDYVKIDKGSIWWNSKDKEWRTSSYPGIVKVIEKKYSDKGVIFNDKLGHSRGKTIPYIGYLVRVDGGKWPWFKMSTITKHEK